MKLRLFVLLYAVVFLLTPLVATGAGAPKKAPAASNSISLDFKDVNLPDFIKTISEFTGKNFIFDETVRGKVTVISPESVSRAEAYQIFLSVLNVKGYTIVPSGEVNKIVLLAAAKDSNLPMITHSGKLPRGEQYVTYLLPLHNIEVADIASSVLTALVPKSGSIVAFPPTNTLILTDSAANIERLVKILHQLDVPDNNETIAVIDLHYVSAEDMAKLVTQVVQETGRRASPIRRGRRTRQATVRTAGGQEAEKVIPFTPTNVLVVKGSDEEVEAIKSIVAKLDQQPSQKRASIHVYYLENADAETLAKTMNEILTGIKTKAATPARPTKGAVAAKTETLEGVSITGDKPTNSLVINCTPEEYDTVRSIIKKLDIKRKQVYVEALVLELSMNATEELGASLQGAVGKGDNSLVFGTSNLNTGQQATFSDLLPASSGGTPTLLGKTINGIMLGGLFSPITVNGPDGTPLTVPALSVLINLSKSDSDINILSAPSLLTSDNEEAEILVGSNVPIITSVLTTAVGTTTATNSGLAQNSTVDRKDVALDLKITPQITEGKQIRLKVNQEITDLAATNVGNVNQVGPTFTKRLLKNTVLAEDGKTIVLGGLISNNVQHTVSKVPVLGDIPLLGWLFKSKSTTDKKVNLLIFITPRIIKDADDLSDVTAKAKRAMDEFQGDRRAMPMGKATEHLEKRLEGQAEGK